MTAFLVKSDILTDGDIIRLLYAEVDMIALSDPSAVLQVAKTVQARCSIGLFRSESEIAECDGVDVFFVPLPDDKRSETHLHNLREAAGQRKLMAVIGPAQGLNPRLGQRLLNGGFDGAVLDTGNNGRLPDYQAPHQLMAFAQNIRASGLDIGFAGGLEPPDIPRLLPCQPDMLCFDYSALSDAALQEIRALIPKGSKSVNLSGAEVLNMDGRDWIFVQDFVLPVEIGAYRHEHGGTQRVRFDVTAEISRSFRGTNTGGPADMRDVVSYDLIMDAIRLIVARGHVVLAEALAEAVAQQVLALDRVMSVRVRVEKLDIAPCRVGVEIERFRNVAR